MSRGPSERQKTLLKLMEKKGYLDAKIAWNELSPVSKGKDGTTRALIESFRENFWKPSETRNINSVYRALVGLTKRGCVAQLIGTRHTIWIPVKMSTKDIELRLFCHKCVDQNGDDCLNLPPEISEVISRGKSVRFRCRDFVCAVWERGEKEITERFGLRQSP